MAKSSAIKARSGYKRCEKCLYTFRSSCVRVCPHPAVRAAYGKTICAYCCRACKYKTEHPYIDAPGCGYKEESG